MSYIIGTATDVGDLLADLDAFLRVGHSLDPVYSRDGDGVIDAILGTATSVQETITVTFSDATNFSVAGSVSGALGSETCGSAFSSSVVSFTITAGTTTPFANGDTISFVMTPPWTRLTGNANLAIASSVYNYMSNPPDFLFDGLATTWFAFNATTGTIEIDLPASKTVASYAIASRSDGFPDQAPKTWTFEYWNGSAWTVADTRSNITTWTAGARYSYTLATPVTATKFRLNITANNGNAGNCAFGSFEILEQTTGTNVALGTLGYSMYQAPGNNGSSQIFVGWQRFVDVTGDYDDLRLFGSAGWDPTLPALSQPGGVQASKPSPVLPLLRVGSIPYWITANGQRVAFTVKNSTVYDSAYLGFLNQYISPNLWPLPLVVAGSFAYSSTSEPASTSTTWRWSYTGNEHSAYPRGNGGTNDAYYQLRFRNPSGVWRGAGATWGTGYVGIYPEYSNGQDLRPGIDGSYPLFPLVLNEAATPANHGELDGVAWVSGHANTSENRVVQKRIPWIVFQNIYRTNKYDYFAMKLA